MFEQLVRVRTALSGPAWAQSFAPGTVPGWLAALVDGHANAYLGVEPVLFRTAGVSTSWFTAQRAHPDQVRVQGVGGRLRGDAFEHALARLTSHGATVDADVYVTGDGDLHGVYTASFHRVFAAFPTRQQACAAAEDHVDDFLVSVGVNRAGHTVELAPRLRVRP